MWRGVIGVGRRAAAVGGALLSVSAAGAQDWRVEPARPTVAVLDFTGSTMRDPETYLGVGKAIPDLLIDALQHSPGVQVLEREEIEAVLREHTFAREQKVAKETQPGLGELLGAQYLVTGGFLVDDRNRIRMTVRAVEVASTRVVYSGSVSQKVVDILPAIDSVAALLTTAMRLPAPTRPRTPPGAPGGGGARPGATADSGLLSDLGRALEDLNAKQGRDAAAVLSRLLASPELADRPSYRAKLEARRRLAEGQMP